MYIYIYVPNYLLYDTSVNVQSLTDCKRRLCNCRVWGADAGYVTVTRQLPTA